MISERWIASLWPDGPVRAKHLQAYSSLGTQWALQGHSQHKVLEDPMIREIAEKLGCSSAQVVLRWALQHGQVIREIRL